MSYDIYLCEPGTHQAIEFEFVHEIRGGTYCMGGTNEDHLNVTYNYGQHFRDAIDPEKGIRWLYGKTGAECIPVLKAAIEKLGTEQHHDYWEATPGNAGRALCGLLAFAQLRPDGVFDGD